MTENREEKMPDFKQLSDRVIAEAPPGPFIGMRTNLDPENPEEYNPYKQKETPIHENLPKGKT